MQKQTGRGGWVLGLLTICIVMFGFASSEGLAQLEITELAYNTVDEDTWEWLEIRNLGAADVDLDGAFLDGLNDYDPPVGAGANISNTISTNTIIPAGGVAVLYDGYQGSSSPATHNDQIFRDAWGLDSSVPLISINYWPGLSNSSSNPDNMSLGIWADRATYDLDITGTPGDGQVSSFANAMVSVNYDVSAPWPSSSNGISVTYSGTGDIADGSNWAQSQAGAGGATTSSTVQVQDSINSTDDVGSPGSQSPFSGTATSGLLITEIMYNPRSSSDNDFEWVEVFNNTGSSIDFAATPHFLDDKSDSSLTGGNIASGSVADGATAVLFSDSVLTAQNMQDIWGATTNFIPVSEWSALNNSGDTFGIWASQADYNADADTGDGRTVDSAVAAVTYDDDDTVSPAWPKDDGSGSIWLTDLALDPNQADSWFLSSAGDGSGISANANAIGGFIDIHPGGDVGSPGTFGAQIAGVPGDYNEDDKVDAADYTSWRDNLGKNITLPNEDPGTTPGVVTQEDYLFWKAQFAAAAAGGGFSAAVPEPATGLLSWMALSCLFTYCRRIG